MQFADKEIDHRVTGHSFARRFPLIWDLVRRLYISPVEIFLDIAAAVRGSYLDLCPVLYWYIEYNPLVI